MTPLRPRTLLIRYGMAVLAVLLVLLLKLAIPALARTDFPFTLFLAAILFGSWFGGIGPGLAATVLAALVADYYFLPPIGSVFVGADHEQLRLLQFVIEGCFISLLSGMRHHYLHLLHRKIEELRVTLNSIGHAVVTTDARGAVDYLNPAAEILTGWQPDEAAGRPLAEVLSLIEEGTGRTIEPPVAEAVQTGRPAWLSAPTLLVNRKGGDRPVDGNASPIRGPGGNVLGAVLVLRDTTDRRRAEARIRAAHRRTAAILESITDAFWTVNRAWRFTYVNARAREYLRLPEGDLRGKVLWEVVPQLAGTVFEEQLRTAQGDRIVTQFEALFPPTGGWMDVRAYPSDLGLSVYFQDITPRKLVEEELRRLLEQLETERAKLRAVLVNLPAAVLLAEAPSGRVVLTNPFGRRLFGPSSNGDAAKSGEWVAFHPDGRRVTAPEAPLARALGGTTVSGEEFQTQLGDGRTAWLRASAAPIRRQDGRVSGAVAVFDDVSREKQAEELLRTRLLTRLATIQEDERRRIARELHDETGQLLTALILGLKALRDRVAELGTQVDGLCHGFTPLQELAEQVGRATHRVAWELRPTALDDLGLARALRGGVEQWAERAGVAADFHCDLGPDRLPPEVETHLYRIVMEGLTNVGKHAGAGRVSVILERRRDHLLVIVEDNGRGFDPEAIRQAASGQHKLGLFGMQERALLVRGTFQIESAPGQGTTVFVRVPLPGEEKGNNGEDNSRAAGG
jgi:PAS domain S-box-containing protein